MSGLTQAECEAWASSQGYDIRSGKDLVDLSTGQWRRVFVTPEWPRNQILLAHGLAERIDPVDGLLWLTDWSSYRPPEMHLFLALRRELGETRMPIDVPGLLMPADLVVARRMLTCSLSLLFGFTWEGFFLGASERTVIWAADGIVEVGTFGDRSSVPVDELLRDLAIEPLEGYPEGR